MAPGPAGTPEGCGQAPDGSRGAGDLEIPRPLRRLLTAGWSLTESAGLPAGAYLTAAWLGGRDAGLIAGLAAIWLTVIIRKAATGSVTGLLVSAAAVRLASQALGAGGWG